VERADVRTGHHVGVEGNISTSTGKRDHQLHREYPQEEKETLVRKMHCQVGYGNGAKPGLEALQAFPRFQSLKDRIKIVIFPYKENQKIVILTKAVGGLLWQTGQWEFKTRLSEHSVQILCL
jgi:hypothetical protein